DWYKKPISSSFAPIQEDGWIMKSEHEQFPTSEQPAVRKSVGRSVDRRRFMESAAAVGGMLTLDSSLWGQAIGAPSSGRTSADSRLPDGTEFVSWEQELKFSKTYYVDNTSPNADDNGPGDKAKPFKTINKAAQVLQPGERVVIAAGIYRECVRPARGGTGPSQMISYEASS